MNIAVDVGNTLTKFGLEESGVVLSSFEWSTNSNQRKDELLRELKRFLSPFLSKDIDFQAILSSVVPSLSKEYVKALEEITHKKVTIVGPGLKTGLALYVDHPKEVGADLIAASIGALQYGKGNLFIADLGTASKYIYLDKEGRFAGLSIAPGLDISAKVLSEKGAALPSFAYEIPPSPLGKNTLDCLKSGLIYGTYFEINGFKNAFEKIANHSLTCFLTGGNASFLAPLFPDYFYKENLVLEGLFSILKRREIHD